MNDPFNLFNDSDSDDDPDRYIEPDSDILADEFLVRMESLQEEGFTAGEVAAAVAFALCDFTRQFVIEKREGGDCDFE